MDDLTDLEKTAVTRIEAATTFDALVQLRAELLGKKGVVSAALKGMGKMPADQRREAGQRINAVKAALEGALQRAGEALQAQELARKLEASRIDVTLPGRRLPRGYAHPLRIVEERIVRSLATLGFTVVEGPHVESDWYNFEALNIPPDHPARDMQDTFFCADRVVLRTHTSNVQIRTMVKRQPPVRILSLGMVFRHDDVDPTHSPVFHQVEGLWVDESVTFADLKGVLHKLFADLFGGEVKIRLRPSFFPFTEPSAEVDYSCVTCGGSGEGGAGTAREDGTCRVCRGSGWLELFGAGMVDPAVLAAVGYDPQKVQGFAFGGGIERIAMQMWGIDDIRLFYENDLRFLRQFSGRG